ncbi:MAG TPA: exodeoxyribonuclease VII small subunit [Phycisphaerae bacterium]|nr:exodeoxyribonuclease VII small subunit [Phycisphaerae bacterium]
MAKDTQSSPPANPTFEESVAQLEGIVAAIESGQVGLEESLAKYEQGMELVKKCRGILDRAEKRIEQLTQQADGLSVEPLDPARLLSQNPPAA